MDYQKMWNKAMSYETYRKRVEELMAEGKVTGNTQSESLLGYTKLNIHRMDRLHKTIRLSETMIDVWKPLAGTVKFLSLTEGWCGDAAQNLPLIEELARSTGIKSRYLLRDDNDDLMQLHLTNGAKSIPIVLLLSNQNEVIASWGPRPAVLQDQVMAYKQKPEPKEPYSEFSKRTQLWYAQNKQEALMEEMTELGRRAQNRLMDAA